MCILCASQKRSCCFPYHLISSPYAVKLNAWFATLVLLSANSAGTPQLSRAPTRSSQGACDLVTSQDTLVDHNDQSSNWNYCDWCILLIIAKRVEVYHPAETILLTLFAEESLMPKVTVNCVRSSEKKSRSHTTLNDKWSSQVTPSDTN